MANRLPLLLSLAAHAALATAASLVPPPAPPAHRRPAIFAGRFEELPALEEPRPPDPEPPAPSPPLPRDQPEPLCAEEEVAAAGPPEEAPGADGDWLPLPGDEAFTIGLGGGRRRRRPPAAAPGEEAPAAREAAPPVPQPDPPPAPPPEEGGVPSAPRPREGKCPQPDYPPAERERGVEGSVVLRVRIGADGEALAVEVDSSSGSAALDAAAAAAVADWLFDPALLRGVPVEAVARVRVRFLLRRWGPGC